jgi:CubicO group peptidase (beta-lactamase class C family)
MSDEARDDGAPRHVDRRRWLLAAGGSALIGACSGRTGVMNVATQSTTRAPSDADLDIAHHMRLASVPGMTVAVIDRNAASVRAYGVTRVGTTEAVTGETVFEAASLSKQVLAYLAHQLVAEEKLELDRPLREYLPLPNTGDPAAQGITARHLLGHASGWRNWRNTRDQPLTSDWAPGSRFGYSGEGYYFLQRVLERVTGRGFLRMSRERLFEPLGMRRTAFMWNPSLDANRAHPHTNRGVAIDSFGVSRGRRYTDAATKAGVAMNDFTHEHVERFHTDVHGNDAPPIPNFFLPNAAASLNTTANDYAAFIRHLFGAGRPILERMLTPVVTINESLGWGLGVGLQRGELGGRDDRRMFWQWGDSGGLKHFLLCDATTSTAVVVFTNGNSGRAVYERVIRAARGADQAAFLAI